MLLSPKQIFGTKNRNRISATEPLPSLGARTNKFMIVSALEAYRSVKINMLG
jgi:hypothetical protein